MKLKLGIILAVFWVCGSCSPVPIIVTKEKNVERLAPVPPAIRVDRFQYDVPTGPMDLIFLVDDGELSEVTAQAFEHDLVRPVVTALNTEERFRALKQIVLVVPNPEGPWVTWIKEKKGPETFLEWLFVRRPDDTPPVLRHTLLGAPRPILSALLSVFGPVLPSDLPSTWVVALYPTRPTAQAPSALNILDKKHLLHFRILQRPVNGLSGGAPQCGLLDRASADRSMADSLAGTDVKEQDLCESNWAVKAREEVLSSIEQQKKRLILTAVPWEPQTIALRGAFQSLQYGTDFEFDPLMNEIILRNPGSFQRGDLFEVSYYTGKPHETLPGNPQPGVP